MNEHSHSHDPHDPPHRHDPAAETPAGTPVDAGSQALAEALRSSFGIVKFVMIALVVVFLGSGFFKVGPDEQAMILRFGRPVSTEPLGPGLHWSFPYPIDEYVKVSISGLRQVSSTVGWYAVLDWQEAAQIELPPGASLNPASDGYLVTADDNIIHARATLYYRVEDPVRFVFGFVNGSNVVQNALNSALIYSAAQFAVDDILLRDVAGFRDAVRARAAQLLDGQEIGVVVEQCDVETVPPRQLAPAFREVLQAGVARGTQLNDARSYENQVLSKATADARSRINLAESERIRIVRGLNSAATNFSAILPEYERNPALFVQQRLSETMGRAMTNVQDKYFLPQRADGKPRELRLMLSREIPKAGTEPEGQN